MAKPQAGAMKRGSFRHLCSLYYDSSTFEALDASTQSWRRRALDDICVKHGDKPVQGDYDGDGKTDHAVWRTDNNWYIRQSTNGSTIVIDWGYQASDIPVQGDYDSDGKTDIAVWRPSTGVWHRLLSNTGAYSPVTFGMSGDKPVVGDYDGDGQDDITIFRPSSGVWYQLNSRTSLKILSFGLNGDIPIGISAR